VRVEVTAQLAGFRLLGASSLVRELCGWAWQRRSVDGDWPPCTPVQLWMHQLGTTDPLAASGDGGDVGWLALHHHQPPL
jgi:hypothetical protein